ncbi:uncharacterized protein C2845_PM07G38460 [Panicum miliaceum]|uniref:Uncharacterized protein n=1 Tax=Panicum miliaceum TaxID=4540 RepID=A0A3L6SQ53_PANMI|nr:uncharacterized protein C2845_PM07G38460 [Panicum miliaceum]
MALAQLAAFVALSAAREHTFARKAKFFHRRPSPRRALEARYPICRDTPSPRRPAALRRRRRDGLAFSLVARIPGREPNRRRFSSERSKRLLLEGLARRAPVASGELVSGDRVRGLRGHAVDDGVQGAKPRQPARRVAIGAGWQSLVAFVSIGCYYYRDLGRHVDWNGVTDCDSVCDPHQNQMAETAMQVAMLAEERIGVWPCGEETLSCQVPTDSRNKTK